MAVRGMAESGSVAAVSNGIEVLVLLNSYTKAKGTHGWRQVLIFSSRMMADRLGWGRFWENKRHGLHARDPPHNMKLDMVSTCFRVCGCVELGECTTQAIIILSSALNRNLYPSPLLVTTCYPYCLLCRWWRSKRHFYHEFFFCCFFVVVFPPLN